MQACKGSDSLREQCPLHLTGPPFKLSWLEICWACHSQYLSCNFLALIVHSPPLRNHAPTQRSTRFPCVTPSLPPTQGHTMRYFTVAPRLPPRATQCGISLLLHACHPPIPARLYARKFNYTFLATGGQEFITERHPSWKKVSCPFKGNEQRLALSGSHGDLLSCCLPHLVTSILLLWMQFNSKCMFQKTL